MNISVNELANTSTANLPREVEIFLAKKVLQEEDNRDSAVQIFQDKIEPVSYTHLTLPTNREV